MYHLLYKIVNNTNFFKSTNNKIKKKINLEIFHLIFTRETIMHTKDFLAKSCINQLNHKNINIYILYKKD